MVWDYYFCFICLALPWLSFCFRAVELLEVLVNFGGKGGVDHLWVVVMVMVHGMCCIYIYDIK